MSAKDPMSWREWLWLCGFMAAFVLTAFAIIVGSAYWVAKGVNL